MSVTLTKRRQERCGAADAVAPRRLVNDKTWRPDAQAAVPVETAALWRAHWRDPDDAAAYTALVEACLPLVTRAVRRLSIQVQSRVDPRELIGSGVQGLHQANGARAFEALLKFTG